VKIAIDMHGTIDSNPEFFSDLIKNLRNLGMEIHITTGVSDSPKLRSSLRDWGIEYDGLFSITDYHKSIGTPILWDEKGNPHIEEEVWDSTKADYCQREKIDLAIDDSTVYEKYFSFPTVYVIWKPSDQK